MRYQWQPLDNSRQEIRVLYLNAGVGDAPLHGQLRHIFLDIPENHRYETISYAWGVTSLTGCILVDGGIIAIPASAVAALRCMRLSDETRALWIDCICIDQQDDSEKNHQVALMSEIYTNAEQTLSYIGEDDGTAAQAFEGITLLYRALEDQANRSIELSQLHHLDIPTSRLSRLEGTGSAIRYVLTRPYFSRLWVIQEVTLSKTTTICCGSLSLDFDVFVAAARWLLCHSNGQKALGTHLSRDLHEAILPAASFITLVVLSKMEVTVSAPLALVLRSSTHFCVSEPRDRVYGLLGLLKQLQRTSSLHSSLSPNYNKPIADVYCDATRTSVLERGDLRQIENEGYERLSHSKIDGLPSWVPNWYCSRTGNRDTGAPYRLPVTPIAWHAWPGRIGTSWLGPAAEDKKVLPIRGVTLALISAHSDAVITRKDLSKLSHNAVHKFISSAHALYSTHNPSMCDTYCERLDHALTAGRPDMQVGKLCCMCESAPMLCKRHLQTHQLPAFAGFSATQESVNATRSAIKIADLLVKQHDEDTRRDAYRELQRSIGVSSDNDIPRTRTVNKRKNDSVDEHHPPTKKLYAEDGHSGDLTLAQCLDKSFCARTNGTTGFTAARETLRTALKYSVNRKIFVTQSGHVGIGPTALQDDDILVVSEISQWPFVLRLAAQRGAFHYTIIGSAYLERIDEALAGILEMGTIYLV